MATSDLGLGGFVPVPDGTGGVGAPVIVSDVINTNWSNGFKLLNAAFAMGDDVSNLAAYPPIIAGAVLDKSYLPPLPPNLPAIDPNDAMTMYQNSLAQINTLIQSGYGDFLTQHFQDGPVYQAAVDWLQDAIANGGSGIRPAVEQALFERDRARIMAESARLENEASSTWSSRGFPLPPGALAGQVADIQLDASRQLAAQSRDIMVKSWEAELTNVRFAVEHALDLRMKALQAAADYIKTLILGPETAVRLATGLSGLKTEVLRAMTALYAAEVGALDPLVRLNITDAQLKQAAQEANQKAELSAIQIRAQAATDAARMVGTAAAAALNGVNVSAHISGSDSSSL